MKVLLVDDSIVMRKIQRGILEQLGYTDVEEALDGQDALDKIDAVGPDLIIMDWNMPRMDGLTFVKRFRAAGQSTPIVIVTTDAEKLRVIEAIDAGVNNYVVKPFTPHTLGERIHETMAQAAPRAA